MIFSHWGWGFSVTNELCCPLSYLFFLGYTCCFYAIASFPKGKVSFAHDSAYLFFFFLLSMSRTFGRRSCLFACSYSYLVLCQFDYLLSLTTSVFYLCGHTPHMLMFPLAIPFQTKCLCTAFSYIFWYVYIWVEDKITLLICWSIQPDIIYVVIDTYHFLVYRLLF